MHSSTKTLDALDILRSLPSNHPLGARGLNAGHFFSFEIRVFRVFPTGQSRFDRMIPNGVPPEEFQAVLDVLNGQV